MKLSPNLVVFITGGASGLGAATVKFFLEKGCKVAVADCDIKTINKLEESFKE